MEWVGIQDPTQGLADWRIGIEVLKKDTLITEVGELPWQNGIVNHCHSNSLPAVGNFGKEIYVLEC